MDSKIVTEKKNVDRYYIVIGFLCTLTLILENTKAGSVTQNSDNRGGLSGVELHESGKIIVIIFIKF